MTTGLRSHFKSFLSAFDTLNMITSVLGVCNDKSSMWICKPTGLNQGRGIFLMRTQEEIAAFRERLQGTMEQQTNKRSPLILPQARVVQQWVKLNISKCHTLFLF